MDIYILILVFLNIFFLSSAKERPTKWNIDDIVIEKRFEIFMNALIKINDKYLSTKRDIFIIDDGKKSTEEFSRVMLNRINNVVTIGSYDAVLKDVKIFHDSQTKYDYSLIVFSGYDDHKLLQYINHLQYHEMFVVLAFYDSVSDEFLRNITNKCIRGGLFHTLAVLNMNDSVQLVRGKYMTGSNCSAGVHIDKSPWYPSIAEKLKLSVFSTKTKVNMRGCILNVSTIIIPPNVINESNTLSGYETKIIEVFANDMNFTPNFRISRSWGGINNVSRYGILGQVFNGTSEIAYGIIWPSVYRKENFDLTSIIESDCLGFAVPRGIGQSSMSAYFGYLTSAFRKRSWILLTFSAVGFCGIFVVYNVLFNKNNSVFDNVSVGFLNTVASLVQKPISEYYPLNCFSLRLIFVMWLFYSQIIGSLYSGELSGIFVAPYMEPNINTLQELLDSEIELGTTGDVIACINAVESNETIYSMVKNRIHLKIPAMSFIPNISNGLQLAYCRNLDTLIYYKEKYIFEKKKDPFHIISGCFVNYPIVMALRKGSPLSRRSNVVLSRIIESGFVSHWKLRIPDLTKYGPSFVAQKLDKLKPAFYFYIGGMILSVFVFISEIVYYNYCQYGKDNSNQSIKYYDFVH